MVTRICSLEDIQALGEASECFGAGLSIEEGDGISGRDFYALLETAAAEGAPARDGGGTKMRMYKKTGLVSQGVTEKPGEFSN